MYSYHNRIKQRIRSGELIDHYFTDHYIGIGPALVLVFSTAPFLRPIRPHKWGEYARILEDWGRLRDTGRSQEHGSGDDNPGHCVKSA